jgi:hypothetical protein
MDMRYHWLTDRVRQKQVDVYWRPGRENLGDYHTKHHSAQHHKDMRHLILHQANSLQVLRGCVKLLPLPHPPHVRARTDTRTSLATGFVLLQVVFPFNAVILFPQIFRAILDLVTVNRPLEILHGRVT